MQISLNHLLQLTPDTINTYVAIVARNTTDFEILKYFALILYIVSIYGGIKELRGNFLEKKAERYLDLDHVLLLLLRYLSKRKACEKTGMYIIMISGTI